MENLKSGEQRIEIANTLMNEVYHAHDRSQTCFNTQFLIDARKECVYCPAADAKNAPYFGIRLSARNPPQYFGFPPAKAGKPIA
jgi:hypothetical protein